MKQITIKLNSLKSIRDYARLTSGSLNKFCQSNDLDFVLMNNVFYGKSRKHKLVRQLASKLGISDLSDIAEWRDI